MKLKRLVSAVLAVGMALTILPTAAFAANSDSNTLVTDLEFGADNLPVDYLQYAADPSNPDPNPNNWSTYNSQKGWSLAIYQAKTYYLDITDGFTYDPSRVTTVPSVIPFKNIIRNKGIIAGGTFTGQVNQQGDSTSKIIAGTFNGGINALSGTVGGVYPDQPVANKLTCNGANISSGIYGGETLNSGTISGGIFKENPSKLATSTPHVLKAPNCSIYGVLKLTDSSPNAYIVGAQKITVYTPAKKFGCWEVEGLTVTKDMESEETIDGVAYKALTFTMPDNDVTITPIKALTPLIIKNGVPVDSENGVIVDENKAYSGDAKNDGWSYNEAKNTFTTTAADESPLEFVDLQNNKVDWKVNNYGGLKNGTVTSQINNYGTVENLIATSYFINKGTIKSGVFSRQADFGEQNPSVRWVTVNGGTVNGMTTAGVVGEQEVTITAPDGFKYWSVAGDTDFSLTEEQKHTNPLTLKLNGEDKGTIILTAQSEEGYYPLNLTDGKAYSVTADGAKDKEITAARAGDTVILEADSTMIPDGMVFDRWEITGDTELTGGFDANAEKTKFTMPNGSVTLRAMYRMADVEEPNVLGTVAIVATAGVGAAVLGWTGYNIAADLYAQSILPEGTAIPETKEALAVMLWQNAGKPEIVAADGTALSETEQAQQWVVANGLMENEEDGSFHPEKGVGKFAALNAIKAQSEAKVSE